MSVLTLIANKIAPSGSVLDESGDGIGIDSLDNLSRTWINTNKVIVYRVMMYANPLLIIQAIYSTF